jgi:hypothetical protein
VPIRLIEFGVATLVNGTIWLAGMWQVGKWIWALL